MGLRPRQQSLEERPAAEHPAGRRIGRDDGMLDAEGTERRGDLESNWTAADDEHRVVARRERRVPRAQLRHLFAARNRRAWAWSIRHMTRGCAMRKASTPGPESMRQRSGRVATTSA